MSFAALDVSIGDYLVDRERRNQVLGHGKSDPGCAVAAGEAATDATHPEHGWGSAGVNRACWPWHRRLRRSAAHSNGRRAIRKY
jgi:hypothetical protein